MNKEEIINYFKDNNPIGLLFHRYYVGIDFNSKAIYNIDCNPDSDGMIREELHSDRFFLHGINNRDIGGDIVNVGEWQRDFKKLNCDSDIPPVETVIHGDISKINKYYIGGRATIKTKDALIKGSDDEAGFLAYSHVSHFDTRPGEYATYTFIAPSDVIKKSVKCIEDDPKVIHSMVSIFSPEWINGVHGLIDGTILIDGYESCFKHQKDFKLSYRDESVINSEIDKFIEYYGKKMKRYELEPRLKEIHEAYLKREAERKMEKSERVKRDNKPKKKSFWPFKK